MWFMYSLSKKLKDLGITVNAVSPGFIPFTGLARDTGFVSSLIMKYVFPWLPFTKSVVYGASTYVKLATDPDLQNITGKYFKGLDEEPSSERAKNEEDQQRLWEYSVKVTGIDFK